MKSRALTTITLVMALLGTNSASADEKAAAASVADKVLSEKTGAPPTKVHLVMQGKLSPYEHWPVAKETLFEKNFTGMTFHDDNAVRGRRVVHIDAVNSTKPSFMNDIDTNPDYFLSNEEAQDHIKRMAKQETQQVKLEVTRFDRYDGKMLSEIAKEKGMQNTSYRHTLIQKVETFSGSPQDAAKFLEKQAALGKIMKIDAEYKGHATAIKVPVAAERASVRTGGKPTTAVKGSALKKAGKVGAVLAVGAAAAGGASAANLAGDSSCGEVDSALCSRLNQQTEAGSAPASKPTGVTD